MYYKTIYFWCAYYAESSVPAVSEDEEFFDATECLSDSRYEEEFEVALPMWLGRCMLVKIPQI